MNCQNDWDEQLPDVEFSSTDRQALPPDRSQDFQLSRQQYILLYLVGTPNQHR